MSPSSNPIQAAPRFTATRQPALASLAGVSLIVVTLAMVFPVAPGLAQTWQPIAALGGPPSAGVPLLLTDGSVMIHHADNLAWFKLTPDINGDYVHGTWTQLANLPSGYGPLYFASAVLVDGRVFVMGGEYNFGVPTWNNRGAIYDPVTNGWTEISAPPGWTQIGDAQCAVLSDGRLMLADPFNTSSAILDPATLTWTPGGPGKVDRFDEEGWTLLPDGSLLTVDALSAPHTERYIPSLNQWVSAGNTPAPLEEPASQELGPMVLRPDGTVVAFGATGHNAIYTPGTNLLDLGTWAAGPDFPIVNGAQLDIADGPACLLPSGNVLCGASPGVFLVGTHFFEFDGATLHAVPGTPHSLGNPSYVGNMLVLPSGQVLYTDQSSDIEIYTPAPGIGSDAGRPTSASCPTILNGGDTFILSGTQFNGLSQCNAYGDDASNAENYPIVRIKNVASGHVFYCRTVNHSTMAVATGSAPTSTQVTVPGTVESGPSTLEVVANGIPSFPVAIAVSVGNTNFPLTYTLAPLTAQSGAAAFVMTVTGANFQNGDTVEWTAGTVTPVATTFVSPSELTASVPAALVANPGSALVRIVRGDGTLGNTATFTTTPAVPVLTSISPSAATQGSLGFTLTVSGQRFASGDVVDWNLNGAITSLVTTIASPTTLTATVPANLLLTAGAVVLNVVDSRGQSSLGATFVVNPTLPVLNAITPSSVAIGSPSFTLTCSGNFFFNTSQVFWQVGGTKVPLATTYVSPVTLTATVPASLLTAQGTANVFVNTPNVGVSATSLKFTITPPLSLISISPNTVVAGTTFTLTANGTDFHPGDYVFINSTLVPATVISGTQLTATIPGSVIPFGGTTSVIIIRSDFTAVSNPLNFTIQLPKPQITALSPSSVAAGGPTFTLTVTGTGFQPASVVRWNGAPILTTYISATQLQATVGALLFAQKNTYTIDVQNPAPGGGGSNGFNLIAF